MSVQLRRSRPISRRLGTAKLVFALFLIAPGAGAELTAAELYSPESATTGTPVRVVLTGLNELAGVTVTLFGPRGEAYQSTRAFRVAEGVHVALLGLGIGATPGSYRVRAQVRLPVPEDRGAGGRAFDGTIEVSAGDFRHERIALDPEMSRLRSEPDPEKVEQARELLRLVSQFRPGAVYETSGFIMPIKQPRITALFGDRRTFVYADGGSAESVHYGLDLVGPAGSEIRAAGAGRVVMAEERIVTGRSVVIEHLPGVYGHYYHLREMNVVPGQRVSRGEALGIMGASGVVTGAHLHWEMRVGGVRVAPRSFVGTQLLDTAREFGIMSAQRRR